MADRDLLRPELRGLAPYNAGLSLEDIAARPGVTRVAKLGSNENLSGIPASVQADLVAAAGNAYLYPDPSARELALALSKDLHCAPDQILFGDGSEDLLNVLARALLRPGDEVITLYPSFPLHEDYAVMMGAQVTRIDLRGGQIDVEALVAAMARPARLVIFANPMNPAGLWLSPQEITRILEAQHPDTVLCIDEAYVEYAIHAEYEPATSSLANHDKPLLILRTFSKAWGLAGLRIGFGVTNCPPLKAGMDLVRTPFNVNSLAQAAALSALEHAKEMEAAVSATLTERARLADGLEKLGLSCLPSAGNFVFVDMGQDAAALAEKLLDHGVIVKAWKQPGYQSFMRISVGLPEDTDQVLGALGLLLSNTGS
ncbi:MAG: histidinol-phosphate transaminase [Mangrovicoccus sp.]